MLLSAMRLQQIEQQQDPIEATKLKLKLIFDHYAQLSDKLNCTTLKSNMFVKLLIDSGVQENQQNSSKCDLIYRAVCQDKKKMHYEAFLNALVKVA